MKITKNNLRKLINESMMPEYYTLETFRKGVKAASSRLWQMKKDSAASFRSAAVNEAFSEVISALQRLELSIEGEQEVQSKTGDAEIRANRRERDAYMMDAMNSDETYQDYDYSPADPRGRDEW